MERLKLLVEPLPATPSDWPGLHGRQDDPILFSCWLADDCNVGLSSEPSASPESGLAGAIQHPPRPQTAANPGANGAECPGPEVGDNRGPPCDPSATSLTHLEHPGPPGAIAPCRSHASTCPAIPPVNSASGGRLMRLVPRHDREPCLCCPDASRHRPVGEEEANRQGYVGVGACWPVFVHSRCAATYTIMG
jgi:hypothetical protein